MRFYSFLLFTRCDRQHHHARCARNRSESCRDLDFSAWAHKNAVLELQFLNVSQRLYLEIGKAQPEMAAQLTGRVRAVGLRFSKSEAGVLFLLRCS